MTNHQGDESTLILDFDIANSAQTEYCSTFHFPSVPPWPLGPLGPMDHMDNLDILQHLDHSHRSNHFDNPDWSMIDQEDNCRIRIVYLVLSFLSFPAVWTTHMALVLATTFTWMARTCRVGRELSWEAPWSTVKFILTETVSSSGSSFTITTPGWSESIWSARMAQTSSL